MEAYLEACRFLELCFHKIEKELPSPKIVEIGNRRQLRYSGKHLEIAILQKLARYISGLNAALVLLKCGYTQEMGVLFRTLDEFHEDIVFLSIPLIDPSNRSDTHNEYLDCFYQEEFNIPDNAFLSEQKRDVISRKRIHAIIANYSKSHLNPHDNQKNMRTLSQLFSGYVHGTSVHIIDMLDGNPPKYFLHGMPNSHRQNEFFCNYWNFCYRGIISMMLTAKVLGFSAINDDCIKFRDYFEKLTGNTGRGDAKKLLRKMKVQSKNNDKSV